MSQLLKVDLVPWVLKELEMLTSQGAPLTSRTKLALDHAAQLIRPGTFQQRVRTWLVDCFGPRIAGDKIKRNHRFLEEALELVQACECSAEEAHALVDYVFNRPVGEKEQEVGGVMVTMAALCQSHELSMWDLGQTELERIADPETMTKIRAKQEAKPRRGLGS